MARSNFCVVKFWILVVKSQFWCLNPYFSWLNPHFYCLNPSERSLGSAPDLSPDCSSVLSFAQPLLGHQCCWSGDFWDGEWMVLAVEQACDKQRWGWWGDSLKHRIVESSSIMSSCPHGTINESWLRIGGASPSMATSANIERRRSPKTSEIRNIWWHMVTPKHDGTDKTKEHILWLITDMDDCWHGGLGSWRGWSLVLPIFVGRIKVERRWLFRSSLRSKGDPSISNSPVYSHYYPIKWLLSKFHKLSHKIPHRICTHLYPMKYPMMHGLMARPVNPFSAWRAWHWTLTAVNWNSLDGCRLLTAPNGSKRFVEDGRNSQLKSTVDDEWTKYRIFRLIRRFLGWSQSQKGIFSAHGSRWVGL